MSNEWSALVMRINRCGVELGLCEDVYGSARIKWLKDYISLSPSHEEWYRQSMNLYQGRFYQRRGDGSPPQVYFISMYDLCSINQFIVYDAQVLTCASFMELLIRKGDNSRYEYTYEYTLELRKYSRGSNEGEYKRKNECINIPFYKMSSKWLNTAREYIGNSHE
jgi:hypothetical protein